MPANRDSFSADQITGQPVARKLFLAAIYICIKQSMFFFLITLLSLDRSGEANVSFRLNESVGKIIVVCAMVVRALAVIFL